MVEFRYLTCPIAVGIAMRTRTYGCHVVNCWSPFTDTRIKLASAVEQSTVAVPSSEQSKSPYAGCRDCSRGSSSHSATATTTTAKM